MDSFYIGDKRIGPDCPPFLIAEMSGNHNQSLQRALDLVDAAAESGAHAIKLQTYTADAITLSQNSEEFQINDKDSLWAGERTLSLFKSIHTLGTNHL